MVFVTLEQMKHGESILVCCWPRAVGRPVQ